LIAPPAAFAFSAAFANTGAALVLAAYIFTLALSTRSFIFFAGF